MWHNVRIYQGNLSKNTIVGLVLHVCCLMIVLAVAGPKHYWNYVAKIGEMSKEAKTPTKPSIRAFLRDEGLETYLQS